MGVATGRCSAKRATVGATRTQGRGALPIFRPPPPSPPRARRRRPTGSFTVRAQTYELLLLDNREPVLCKGLDLLAVRSVRRDRLHRGERLVVQINQNRPRVHFDLETHQTRR